MVSTSTTSQLNKTPKQEELELLCSEIDELLRLGYSRDQLIELFEEAAELSQEIELENGNSQHNESGLDTESVIQGISGSLVENDLSTAISDEIPIKNLRSLEELALPSSPLSEAANASTISGDIENQLAYIQNQISEKQANNETYDPLLSRLELELRIRTNSEQQSKGHRNKTQWLLSS